MATTPIDEPDMTGVAPDPESFDVDGWIAGATTNELLCPIYQRPNLLARMQELADMAQEAELDKSRKRGVADPVNAILREYREVKAELDASKIMVRVRGLQTEHAAEVQAKAALKIPKKLPQEVQEERAEESVRRQILAVMLEAIVFPKFRDTAQLREFSRRIGEGQWSKLCATYKQAAFTDTDELVNADFWPESSPTPDDEDS